MINQLEDSRKLIISLHKIKAFSELLRHTMSLSKCISESLFESQLCLYRHIKLSIQRPSSLHVTAFTFSLLIKICTTASKFYSFLRTSISIYGKKWKSAVYGVPSRAGKTFASTLPGRGAKSVADG